MIGLPYYIWRLSEVDARTLLEHSRLLVDITEDSIVFHEFPYYWAMHLIHAQSNPNWHKELNLWPPPNDYLPKLASRK